MRRAITDEQIVTAKKLGSRNQPERFSGLMILVTANPASGV